MTKPRRLAYRVEDSAHKGPWSYRGGGDPPIYSVPKEHYHAGTMPTVGRDKLLRPHQGGWDQELRWAFPSVEVLRSWFCPATLTHLSSHGYVCGVYAATWEGHTLYEQQITFDVNTAIRLKEVPLTRLVGVPLVRATSTLTHALL